MKHTFFWFLALHVCVAGGEWHIRQANIRDVNKFNMNTNILLTAKITAYFYDRNRNALYLLQILVLHFSLLMTAGLQHFFFYFENTATAFLFFLAFVK